MGGGNDTVTISCLAPAQTRPGTYSAVVSIPDYGHISYATVDYDAPGIVIALGASAGAYKTMQSMTSDVCENWAPTPAAFTSEIIPVSELAPNEANARLI